MVDVWQREEPTRRGHILAGAAELFAANGFETTSVREIAEAAGIQSGSLYHHFPSKDAMVDEIVVDFLERLLLSYDAAVEGAAGPRERFEGVIQASVAAIARSPAACAIYQNEQ